MCILLFRVTKKNLRVNSMMKLSCQIKAMKEMLEIIYISNIYYKSLLVYIISRPISLPNPYCTKHLPSKNKIMFKYTYDRLERQNRE